MASFELVLVVSTLSWISLEYISQLVDMFMKMKQQKVAGQTPLYFRNFFSLVIAYLAEIAVTLLIVYLFMLGNASEGYSWYAVAAFVFCIYILKTLTSYFVVWGLWSIFVLKDKKKMKKEVQKDIDEAKGK